LAVFARHRRCASTAAAGQSDDRRPLSAAGVDWAWYSGGWSNADGDIDAPGWTNGSGPNCSDPNAIAGSTYPRCPDKLFQFHHQAFNYFSNYAPGTTARSAHLKDEAEFIAAAQNGKLKPVSFIKPVGEENEHPGYTGEAGGSDHLVDLISAIVNGPQGRDTLIIVTYDEFGGQWDHVPPPPFGGTGWAIRYDQWDRHASPRLAGVAEVQALGDRLDRQLRHDLDRQDDRRPLSPEAAWLARQSR